VFVKRMLQRIFEPDVETKKVEVARKWIIMTLYQNVLLGVIRGL
jgi:hypothetical protein